MPLHLLSDQMPLLLWQPEVWEGWRRVRKRTQTYLKYGPRGPTRAKLGLALEPGWGGPWDMPPAEEECGHQQQKFPTVIAETELRGTTSEAGEKEQPRAHSVLASLQRAISQIAFLWCGHLSAGSCPATALISCKVLNCHQPGATFNHCCPGLRLNWQLGCGKQSMPLPQFESLELSSPP